MKYLLVADIAKKWNMSERSVRNYCAKGRVNGANDPDDWLEGRMRLHRPNVRFGNHRHRGCPHRPQHLSRCQKTL